MKYLIPAFLLIISQAISQEPDTDVIMEEAYMLYHSEKTSWIASDMLFGDYKEFAGPVRGYFSYPVQDKFRCVFFDSIPNIVFSVTIDSAFNNNKVRVETEKRELTEYENEIYKIRKITYEGMEIDTLFKYYQNTSFNLIPVINGGERIVYILTAPRTEDVVLLGNDYLIKYDENNNVIEKKKLHQNLIPIPKEGEEGKEALISMHMHAEETGPFITPTDICTLMLYKDFVSWQQHYVFSEKYVSMYNMMSNNLMIITMEAFETIMEKQKESSDGSDIDSSEEVIE